MPSTRHRLTKRSIGLVTLEALPTMRVRRPYFCISLSPDYSLSLAACFRCLSSCFCAGRPHTAHQLQRGRRAASHKACVIVHTVESAMAVCYTRSCGAPFATTVFVVQHSHVIRELGPNSMRLRCKPLCAWVRQSSEPGPWRRPCASPTSLRRQTPPAADGRSVITADVLG